ncbi:MAG: TerD family protein [Ignavibacteria bacterium]|nr:TerD family protein [Ignavibacteria bacterium]
MAINLDKKQKFNLSKAAPGLNNVFAGLGWDTSIINGKAVDCDVSVFMLGESGKIPSEEYFVFYNNLQSPDGAVKHMGDSREGVGEGDDEVIQLTLDRVSPHVVQIFFTVTIFESDTRRHSFGNVDNAFIRICNQANGAELCRYTLSENYSEADSLIIGRLYRSGNEWEFEAMGEPCAGGLGALVDFYA